MTGYVYILASKKDGALYTGVTSDLIRRVYEHKNSFVKSHTQKYNIKKLVYFEVFETVADAIAREKQIKRWRRDKKIFLIEQDNPAWDNLYEGICK